MFLTAGHFQDESAEWFHWKPPWIAKPTSWASSVIVELTRANAEGRSAFYGVPSHEKAILFESVASARFSVMYFNTQRSLDKASALHISEPFAQEQDNPRPHKEIRRRVSPFCRNPNIASLKAQRGRGTLETEKPPIFGMIQRTGQLIIELLSNVQQKTMHYSLARIEEKISYLHFLQTYQRENVKNPCGWLRKAIEDDFAAPDGYLSPAAQDAQLAAKLAFADQLLEPLEAHAAAPRPELFAPPQASAEIMEADHILWQQTLVDLKTMGRAYLCALHTGTHVVRCTDETVIVGVPHAFHCTQLQHP